MVSYHRDGRAVIGAVRDGRRVLARVRDGRLAYQASDATSTDPGTTDPGTTDPGTTDPGTSTPAPAQPPAPSTAQPTDVASTWTFETEHATYPLPYNPLGPNPNDAASAGWTSEFHRDRRSAPTHEHSAEIITELLQQLSEENSGEAWLNVNEWDFPYHTVKPEASLHDIGFRDEQRKGYTPDVLYKKGGGEHFKNVRMPDGVDRAAGRDGSIGFYDPVTGRCTELWRYQYDYADGSWRAKTGGVTSPDAQAGDYTYKDHPSGTDFVGPSTVWGGAADRCGLRHGYHPQGMGVSAAALIYGGMILSVRDGWRAKRGIGVGPHNLAIPHTVTMAIKRPRSWKYFSWPAQRSDGGSGETGVQYPEEGAVLVLPQSYDVEARRADVASGKISELCFELMRTAQILGLIVADKAGTVGIGTENAAAIGDAYGETHGAVGDAMPWYAGPDDKGQPSRDFGPMSGWSKGTILRGFPWGSLRVIAKDYGKPGSGAGAAPKQYADGGALPVASGSSGGDADSTVAPSDTTPPTVSISQPEPSKSVSGTTSVLVLAEDPSGVTSVTVAVDGTSLGAATRIGTSTTWSVDWDTTKHANGAAKITATAVDAKGNSATHPGRGTTVANAAVADTEDPQVSIIAPESGSTVYGTVEVVVEATDNVGVTGVDLLVGSTVVGPMTFATGSWRRTVDTTTAANGPFMVTARARDAAGNSFTHPGRNVTVKNVTAPAKPASGLGNLDYSGAQRVTAFTSTSQVTKVSGKGTATITTEDPSPGTSTALRLATADTSDTTWGVTFPAPLDLADAFLRFPLRTPDQRDIRLDVYLATSKADLDAGRYRNYSVLNGVSNTAGTEWSGHGMHPAEMYNAALAPDMSSVRYMELRARAYSTASGATVHVDIPWIEVQPNTAAVAQVAIWADDGGGNAWSVLKPELDKRGLVATIATIPDKIGGGGALTVANLAAMSQAGWGIEVHSYAGHITKEGQALADDLDASIAWLKAKGLPDPHHFAFWGGPGPLSKSAANRALVAARFATGRWNTSGGATGRPDTMPPFEPMLTRGWLVGSTDTAEDWIGFVKKAQDMKGLAEFVFHNDFALSKLVPLLDYLQAEQDAGRLQVVSKAGAMANAA